MGTNAELNLGKRPNLLRHDEVTKDVVPFLDFESQQIMPSRNGKSTAMHIHRQCPMCKQWFWTEVTKIRYWSKAGNYSGLCFECSRHGSGNARYIGSGQELSGYRWVSVSNYIGEDRLILEPMMDANYHVAEHRAVMALKLRRSLQPHELVRHLNGDKADNRIENLAIGDTKENHNDHYSLYLENIVYKQMMANIEKRVEVINSELGDTRDIVREIVGELRIIKVIMIATSIAALGQLVAQFFGF